MRRRRGNTRDRTAGVGPLAMRYGQRVPLSSLATTADTAESVKDGEQQDHRGALLLHLTEDGARRQTTGAVSTAALSSSPNRRFHAAHQKEQEQNRQSTGSQSGYDSDSTINDNDPGRPGNE